MADDAKRNEGVIVGGEALILCPKNGEEFEKAIAQHHRVVVDALKGAAKMVHYGIKNLNESQKDRAMRIITDTWRHLTPSEKAQQLLMPFLEAGNNAHQELAQQFGQETNLESKPQSESVN